MRSRSEKGRREEEIDGMIVGDRRSTMGYYAKGMKSTPVVLSHLCRISSLCHFFEEQVHQASQISLKERETVTIFINRNHPRLSHQRIGTAL